MDKGMEGFAESIKKMNMKTVRQSKVLFLTCLMAGIFWIMDMDNNAMMWIVLPAVYFFTDTFYMIYLKVEMDVTDELAGSDIYQFIGQHAFLPDGYFKMITEKFRKYGLIILAEYLLIAVFSDEKVTNIFIALLCAIAMCAAIWARKKYFMWQLMRNRNTGNLVLGIAGTILNILKFLLISLISIVFEMVVVGNIAEAVEPKMISGQTLERYIGISAFIVMIIAGFLVSIWLYAYRKPSKILNSALITALAIGVAGVAALIVSGRLWYYEINYSTQKITVVHVKEKQYDFSDVQKYEWKSDENDDEVKTLELYLDDGTVLDLEDDSALSSGQGDCGKAQKLTWPQ